MFNLNLGGLGLDAASSILPPAFALLNPDFYVDYVNNVFYGANSANSNLTVSRTGGAAAATDMTPLSAGGNTINGFTTSQARIIAGNGLLIEPTAINNLLNSTAPVTLTTASLGTGSYVLWVNSGSGGTAAVTAGTATLTGNGTASQGTPNVFSITVAGTVTITVSGSLTAFQLESATAEKGTSLVKTSGTTTSRGLDIASYPFPTLGSAATIFAEVNPISAVVTNGVIAGFSDGTANNRFILNINGTSSVQGIATNGGTAFLAAVSGVTITPGTKLRAATSFTASTSIITAVNGGAAVTNTTSPVAFPTMTVFGPGPNQNGQVPGFRTRFAAWYSRALTGAQLTSITT